MCHLPVVLAVVILKMQSIEIQERNKVGVKQIREKLKTDKREIRIIGRF